MYKFFFYCLRIFIERDRNEHTSTWTVAHVNMLLNILFLFKVGLISRVESPGALAILVLELTVYTEKIYSITLYNNLYIMYLTDVHIELRKL
jgi:hypothetical protein